MGEALNNFATRLKILAEHCDCDEEQDNRVRDIVISHITKMELTKKFYLEENLSISRLLEIVGTYHNKTKVKAMRLRIASSYGRANVRDVISRATWRKIVTFPV